MENNWVLCDVISLHRWWERWEILSCFRNHPVLDGGIKAWQLLAKIKSFICDVIPYYHLIRGKRNRTSNPQECIFPWKWSECSVMWYFYIADEKGQRICLVPGRILYLFTKAWLLLAKIKSLICDVVTDYHVIAQKHNRTSYRQERIFPLKFTRVLTHRNFFSWK